MPIKFRCVHCNQKLGIAGRKAGTQVQCPTCLQMVSVPLPDAEPVQGGQMAQMAPVAAGAAVVAPLFERSDFEDILKAPKPERVATPRPMIAAPAAAPAPVWSAPLPSAYDVEQVPRSGESFPGMAPAGILLTPGRATVLAVVVVLLLGAAFGAGLVIGRML